MLYGMPAELHVGLIARASHWPLAIGLAALTTVDCAMVVAGVVAFTRMNV